MWTVRGFFIRTPDVRSRNYWVSVIKKTNQMANRTLNFETGNGNWWGPRNHERKLLIGPEHTLHWIHWRISCSCVGKYGWKTVESRCNLVWFFDSVLWRELVVSLWLYSFFIRLKFDHSLCISFTDWVTDWLTALLKNEWVDLNMATKQPMLTM